MNSTYAVIQQPTGSASATDFRLIEVRDYLEAITEMLWFINQGLNRELKALSLPFF